MSRRFLLLGHPVGHSLSPAMFAAAFAAAGIDATYHALDVAPGALARELPRLLAEGAQGFNLTVPHKQAVLPLLAALDPGAARVGAVNTVALREAAGGRVATGFNTDVGGFLRGLAAAGAPPPPGSKVLILGAGGAARAVLAALARAGAGETVIASRSPGRAEELAAWARAAFPDIRCRAALFPAPSSSPGALLPQGEGASLCVQATPLGLRTGDPLPLDPALLPPGCFLYDLVYAPGGTPLVRRALALGRSAADGREMLLGQAAEAFTLWCGAPAPEAAMRAALELGLA